MNTTAYQIIAVDFDGTLCYSNWPELGEPNRPLIEYLINQKRSGNKLILWPCRAVLMCGWISGHGIRS